MPISRAPRASRPALYLPDGWDSGWKAAKAAASTTPAGVLALGDSVTYATGSTSPTTLGWFALLRTSLRTRHGGYADLHAVYRDTGGTLTPYWAGTAGAPAQATGYGVASAYVGVGTGTLTYTAPSACTDLDILYHDRIAGTWAWSLDGGAQTGTVTTTGDLAVKRLTFRGLASSAHTVACSTQSATNVLALVGAVHYTSLTTGLGFANVGVGALSTLSYLSTAQVQLLGGWQSAGAPTGMGFPAKPALAFLGMGINDCAGTTLFGPQQHTFAWGRVIQALRRGYPGCAIVLLSWNNPHRHFWRRGRRRGQR